ncbi:hypothetical protein C7N43_10745 [Sphingobacteriales bacterium UPWRP_1]|nr:hypothetical protein BVG80_14085 [Sphingobacteriales bacterium TSM_CSM]PSJ77005.1 hypothetical protein C7N43_10745 [Sphingobacteriales bacterium UPWRP_1]
MQQKILVLLLVAGMLAQSLSQFAIYISYYANRAYITQKYCINKDKPFLHCLGKCHLKTVLTENEKHKQGQLPGATPVQEWWQYANNLFCCSQAICIQEPLMFLAGVMNLPFIFTYRYKSANAVYRPPWA